MLPSLSLTRLQAVTARLPVKLRRDGDTNGPAEADRSAPRLPLTGVACNGSHGSQQLREFAPVRNRIGGVMTVL
jgi:hypothetical protein